MESKSKQIMYELQTLALSQRNLRKALMLAPAFLWPQQLNVPGRKGTVLWAKKKGEMDAGSTLRGAKGAQDLLASYKIEPFWRNFGKGTKQATHLRL